MKTLYAVTMVERLTELDNYHTGSVGKHDCTLCQKFDNPAGSILQAVSQVCQFYGWEKPTTLRGFDGFYVGDQEESQGYSWLEWQNTEDGNGNSIQLSEQQPSGLDVTYRICIEKRIVTPIMPDEFYAEKILIRKD